MLTQTWGVTIKGVVVLTNMVIISKQENDTDTCFRLHIRFQFDNWSFSSFRPETTESQKIRTRSQRDQSKPVAKVK